MCPNGQISVGFRHVLRTSIASTLMNELSADLDLIELQLIHAERNTVGAAYDRIQHLAQRRVMCRTGQTILTDSSPWRSPAKHANTSYKVTWWLRGKHYRP